MRFDTLRDLLDFAKNADKEITGTLELDSTSFAVQILPKLSKSDPIIINIGESSVFVYPDCIDFHTNPNEHDLLWDSLKEYDMVSHSNETIISGNFNEEEIIKIMKSSVFKDKIDEAIGWMKNPHLFVYFSSGDFFLQISEGIELENQFELDVSRFLSHGYT